MLILLLFEPKTNSIKATTFYCLKAGIFYPVLL